MVCYVVDHLQVYTSVILLFHAQIIKILNFYLVGGTLNPKFAHVKSSGYGASYSPSKQLTMKERPSSSKERLEKENNDRQKRRHDRKLDVTERLEERVGILDRKGITDVWSPVDVAKQKVKGKIGLNMLKLK